MKQTLNESDDDDISEDDNLVEDSPKQNKKTAKPPAAQ